jgi:hypothetical protein
VARSLFGRTARALLAVALSIPLLGLVSAVPAQQARGTVRWEAPLRVPSPESTSSWFPDLAVDREGRVHVVWCETAREAEDEPLLEESVYYAAWAGAQWSPANDLVPPDRDITRNAIAVDDRDVLHLLFNHAAGPADSLAGLYYKQAAADEAFSAAAWTSPRLVNGRGFTYMSDLAVDGDTLHVVYDDMGAAEGECPGCADVYYRRSADRGATWSAPLNLVPTSSGSGRAQIEMDDGGTIHVAWDEGWDRLTGRGEPRCGLYTSSADGGITWAAPTVITQPVVALSATPPPTPTTDVAACAGSANAQLSVGSDGQGGVMLVWRTTSPEYPGIYYTWSADRGESWSPPRTIPRVVARRWGHPFDAYDMASDGDGRIHLLAVAHLSAVQETPPAGETPGLYHLEWYGSSWSRPAPIQEADWYPEYPHLVVERGNRFHATWFVRLELWERVSPYQVWYARGESGAAEETPVPWPTSTPSPVPTSGAAVVTRTATLYPTIAPGAAAPPEGLYTDVDDAGRMLIALLPTVALILLIVIARRAWGRRRFR